MDSFFVCCNENDCNHNTDAAREQLWQNVERSPSCAWDIWWRHRESRIYRTLYVACCIADSQCMSSLLASLKSETYVNNDWQSGKRYELSNIFLSTGMERLPASFQKIRKAYLSILVPDYQLPLNSMVLNFVLLLIWKQTAGHQLQSYILNQWAANKDIKRILQQSALI